MSLFEDEPPLATARPLRLRRDGGGSGGEPPGRRFVRQVLVIFYAVAGVLHLLWPKPFIGIVPGWVPWPGPVVMLTGVAELAGAVALVQGRWPALRRAGGWGLGLYALCVWPANFHHMMLDMAKPGHGWWLLYHVPRLMAQPVLIWVAPWAAGVRFRR